MSVTVSKDLWKCLWKKWVQNLWRQREKIFLKGKGGTDPETENVIKCLHWKLVKIIVWENWWKLYEHKRESVKIILGEKCYVKPCS